MINPTFHQILPEEIGFIFSLMRLFYCLFVSVLTEKLDFRVKLNLCPTYGSPRRGAGTVGQGGGRTHPHVHSSIGNKNQ